MTIEAAAVEAPHAVDHQHPWPGLAAFEEGDEPYFKGRDQEIAALSRLVARENFSLLWGLSGLGKTSLLRAGLFPRLREADIFPIYVRLSYASHGPDEGPPLSLTEQCFEAIRQAGELWNYEVPEPAPSASMWEYMRRRHHRFWGPGDRLVTPLLVFDQFEELFTRDRAPAYSSEALNHFFRDLSGAVSGGPPAWLVNRASGRDRDDGDYLYRPGALKVLLSFREEFIAHVSELTPLVGAIADNYERLTSMTFDQGVTVVRDAGGHLIDAASPSEQLALCQTIVAQVTGATTPEAQRRVTVDPALLSLFCSELNERRQHPGRAPAIDRALVESADASQIISRFYESCLSHVSEATRRFVEDQLVLATTRTRESRAEDAAREAGVTSQDLDFLIDKKRILRREKGTRSGQSRLELTHDVLVEPALAARERRQAEDTRAQIERERVAREQEARALEERQRQAREVEVLSERLALQQQLAAERTRADAEARARRDQKRNAYIALLVIALLVLAAAYLAYADSVRRQQAADAEQQLVSTVERAVDDASAARPAQALARLAFVLRKDPQNVVARSLALDLMLRQPWLLPVATFADEPAAAATAFSDDGRLAATVSTSGALRVWETDTAARIGPERQHAGTSIVRFNEHQPDRLLTVSSRRVRVWSNEGAAAIADIPVPAPAGVTAAVFVPARRETRGSEDTTDVAIASSDGWVRVWSVSARKPPSVRLQMKRTVAATTMEISPGGDRLLLAGGDSATLWSLDPAVMGRPTELRHESGGGISAASFNPYGSLVATGTANGEVVLWQVFSSTRLAEKTMSGKVRRIAFSPSGEGLLTIVERHPTSLDSTATLWHVPLDSRPRTSTTLPLERYVDVRSADPDVDGAFVDDHVLVLRSSRQSVRLVDAGTGLPVAIPLRLKATSIGLDSARRKLIIASSDQPTTAWAVRLAARPVEMLGYQPVLSTRFSPDGRSVLTASTDQTARIWRATDGEPEQQFFLDKPLLGAEYSRDGRQVLTYTREEVYVWTVSGEPVGSPLTAPGGRIISARFDPDGRRVVTASLTGTATIWDVPGGNLVRTLPGRDSLWSAEFSPKGDRIVTASEQGLATVWDIASGTAVGEPLKHAQSVVSARFDHDGARVVTASSDGLARVWTLDGSRPLLSLRHSDRVNSAEFTRDGRRIVTTSNDWTARVWTLGSGPPAVMVLPHDAPVGFAEISADDSRLLTVSTHAGVARVWDIRTGLPLTQNKPTATVLWSARFSPDGRQIVTGWEDGSTRIVDVPSGDHSDGEWIAGLAEAIGGRRIEATGATGVVANQGARLADLRKAARDTAGPTLTFQQRFLRRMLIDGP
jgi:WD40 repeat protein